MLIVLKKLSFSNTFSYGPNNTIDFTNSCLTQLVGKNGEGKSSIALILEEVLFNKNSRGIKKGDILNRYIEAKVYNISLDFSAGRDNYTIEVRRSSTQTVKLFKNDEDISSHTATATYKHIESIIGIDHKTFSQIVYQSHAGSLKFLTSPDTARKEFLIELLNLNKYTLAGDLFKSIGQELSRDCSSAQAKLDTINSWIAKYNKTSLTEKPIWELPQQPDQSVCRDLEKNLEGIEKTNKRITQNNTYKQLQAAIKVLPQPDPVQEDTENLVKNRAEYKVVAAAAEANIKKMRALHGTCPTCLQNIDETKTKELIDEYSNTYSAAIAAHKQVSTSIQDIEARKHAWDVANKSQLDWEKYHQLIDTDLQEVLLDANTLRKEITELRNSITESEEVLSKIIKANAEATAHNSKVSTIREQLEDMRVELNTWQAKLTTISARLNIINTLQKTFSTTGLVAYKIENLVKDLEYLANEYLAELSGGRFQISFQISGSDKLNVVITDDGADIDMCALSGGETARVNVATLLAIRKLMQALSQTRINLLILDETVENLDVEGKEKLVEVLLTETDLNTVLISHSFSHPLIAKINVIKTDKISRIEEQ